MRRILFALVALGASAGSADALLACGSASSASPETFDASDLDAGTDGAGGDAAADTSAAFDGVGPTVKCAHTPCATHLRAGASFACAILHDGSARCWGDDADGQLGQSDGGLPSGKPLRVGTWSDAIELSAYGSIMGSEVHEGACVRHASGDVTCWGDDSGGQLELGTVTAAERVAAGPTTSCAIRAGELVCFGPLAPRAFAGSHGALAVATSLHAALVITNDGRLWSWGTASAPPRFISPLGRSVSSEAAEPGTVADLPAVSKVVASAQHACALAEGRVFCWGDNEDGQLGIGSHVTSERPLEIPLPDNARATSLALSERTTCVTTSDGRAFCWGANEVGQLGSGDYKAHFRPTAVRPLEAAIVEMAPMNYASCALLESGKIACWGFNGTGCLGTGSIDFDEHLDPATVQLDAR